MFILLMTEALDFIEMNGLDTVCIQSFTLSVFLISGLRIRVARPADANQVVRLRIRE